MTYPDHLKPDNPRFLAGLFAAIFVLILALALQSCSHTNKHKSETSSKIDSANVKYENNIDIKNHTEDSSHANTKIAENSADSSNTKTITVIFDKDTTDKPTEISINLDNEGNVNIKSNKPVNSVNTTKKQFNKKQEKQFEGNTSNSKKVDNRVKASNKGNSTNKKADVKATNKDVDKGGFNWAFLWWLISLLLLLTWLFRFHILNWLNNINNKI